MEALIAFVVFALGALAVAGLLTGSIEMNADAKARTQALHLAKEKLSEFRHFATNAEVLAYTSDATGDTFTGNNATFTRTWTVTDVANNDRAYLVTVDVAWTDNKGAQNVSLQSQLAKLKPERTGTYLLAFSGGGGGGGGPGEITTEPDMGSDDPGSDETDTDETEPVDTEPVGDEPVEDEPVFSKPTLYSCSCDWTGAGNSGNCKLSISSSPDDASSCCSKDMCVNPPTECGKKETISSLSQCSGLIP